MSTPRDSFAACATSSQDPEYGADPFWQCETAKQALYRYAIQGSKPGGDVIFRDLRGHSFTIHVLADGNTVDVVPDDRAALTEALRLIAAQQPGGCERSTSGAGACFANERTADATYGIDRACPACIARAALNGQPIPRGIGAEAEKERTSR